MIIYQLVLRLVVWGAAYIYLYEFFQPTTLRPFNEYRGIITLFGLSASVIFYLMNRKHSLVWALLFKITVMAVYLGIAFGVIFLWVDSTVAFPYTQLYFALFAIVILVDTSIVWIIKGAIFAQKRVLNALVVLLSVVLISFLMAKLLPEEIAYPLVKVCVCDTIIIIMAISLPSEKLQALLQPPSLP